MKKEIYIQITTLLSILIVKKDPFKILNNNIHFKF